MSKGQLEYLQQTILLQFQVYRKHFFSEKPYFLCLFPDKITIAEKLYDSMPKYVVPLDLSTRVEWQAKRYPNVLMLEALGIQKAGKVKFFKGNNEKLQDLKRALNGLVMFKNFEDFYQINKQVGKGSCSKVFQVTSYIDRSMYVSKCVSKKFLMEDPSFLGYNGIFLEIQMMNRVKHKNTISFIEVFESDEYYNIILEYLDGGTLDDWFNEKQQFQFQESILILQQLLVVATYIHGKQIMHRDLKPQNVMFAEKNNIMSLKIIDFGMATSSDVDQFLFSKCGTPGYIAPEIANLKNPQQKYGCICDVFSIGAIFYKLLTAKELFVGQNAEEIFYSNRRCLLMGLNSQVFESPNPKATKDILKKLLQPGAKDRISARDALKHESFKDFPLILEENTAMQIEESKDSHLESYQLIQEKNKTQQFLPQLIDQNSQEYFKLSQKF